MSEYNRYTVEFLKILGDPARLEILEFLKGTEKRTSEIQKKLKRSQSTISKHLNLLFDNNLIEFERRNNIKYYKIRHTEIYNLINRINSFAIAITKDKLKEATDIDRFNTLL
jgi:ArsR family transcriptional regulator